ncbi:PhnD/SsuA/transferrin family substrate-binding protein [uncultured Sphingomonas sp.]|uniref:phosphate/phosphite/phosphonate ABC transporter substrate-binding protein n=1 Tax=uncultured Sphingomonas sp. TaxID=158754 RepID=UPI0025D46D4A|nr:PhnD/SsuA/transferrin family substrate-binding protein [uncultured Sphingomonas sp.]
MSVASLGMYDHPAQGWANDALWAAIAGHLREAGIDAPDELDHRAVEAVWRDPDLLLAQACGLPLVADPELDLTVVAVPSYAVAGCAPGRHLSRIIVHADDDAADLADLRGQVAAINAPLSNTGANLLRAAFGGLPFSDVRVTGSHRASVAAVAGGKADVAAIDAVTFAALRRYEPEAVTRVRVLADTVSVPALPFVTARRTPPATRAALREALVAAAHDPALGKARDALFLADIVPASRQRYGEVARLARETALA